MVFRIRTDHEIEASRPDLRSSTKKRTTSKQLPKRGRESIKTSRSRERNSKDVGVRTKVIPIVEGALGTIPLTLKEYLRTIGADAYIELTQRCALLGSARILKKVLEMYTSKQK